MAQVSEGGDGIISRDAALRDGSLLAHFPYGAAAGALIASTGTKHKEGAGSLLVAAVWAAAISGGFSLCDPETGKPTSRQRNTLMIGAHLVSGAMTTWSIRELAVARDTIVAAGPLRDAPAGGGADHGSNAS